MGPAITTPPTVALQSNAPVRASSARKYPSRPPANSTSEAVVRMPLSVTLGILSSHFRSPVKGSRARMAPYPVSDRKWFSSSPLQARGFSRYPDGSRAAVKSAGPVHLHERSAKEKLSGDPVQNVKEPVPVRPHHDSPWLCDSVRARPLEVGQHRDLHRVVVHLIVRRELIVPGQLPRVCVQRDHRLAIQIVAVPVVAVPVRSW